MNQLTWRFHEIILIITLSLMPRPIYANTVSMYVGEQRAIELPGATKVHVSRRGVVHLVYLSESTWRVTALKTGMAAVETKKPGALSETMYFDVMPRPHSKPLGQTVTKSHIAADIPCSSGASMETYAIAVFVELMDEINGSTSGGGPKAIIDFDGLPQSGGSPLKAGLTMRIQPESSRFQRTLIADPEVLTRPCEPVDLSMGGEDIYQLSESRGDATTSWKEHGLRLHLEVIPKDRETLKIPFSVILRTPSRGHGAYGLSEVQSTITTRLSQRILAATINLKSKTSSERSSWVLRDIPIIGPLFRGFDQGNAASKLLISILARPLDNFTELKDEKIPEAAPQGLKESSPK